jgi:hypothetical protein
MKAILPKFGDKLSDFIYRGNAMAKVTVCHISRASPLPAEGLGLKVEYDKTTVATILIQPPQSDPATVDAVRNEILHLAAALQDAAHSPQGISVLPQASA